MKAERALQKVWFPELKPREQRGGVFRVRYPLGAVGTYVGSWRSLFLNHAIGAGIQPSGTADEAQAYCCISTIRGSGTLAFQASSWKLYAFTEKLPDCFYATTRRETSAGEGGCHERRRGSVHTLLHKHFKIGDAGFSNCANRC